MLRVTDTRMVGVVSTGTLLIIALVLYSINRKGSPIEQAIQAQVLNQMTRSDSVASTVQAQTQPSLALTINNDCLSQLDSEGLTKLSPSMASMARNSVSAENVSVRSVPSRLRRASTPHLRAPSHSDWSIEEGSTKQSNESLKWSFGSFDGSGGSKVKQ